MKSTQQIHKDRQRAARKVNKEMLKDVPLLKRRRIRKALGL